MSVRNLDKMFNPKSTALIGASDTSGKLGYTIFRDLIKGEFKGGIYPVNPKYKTIQGKKAYKSVTDIRDEVDLAVIVTPIDVVPWVIKDCTKKNSRSYYYLSGRKRDWRKRKRTGRANHQGSGKRGYPNYRS